MVAGPRKTACLCLAAPQGTCVALVSSSCVRYQQIDIDTRMSWIFASTCRGSPPNMHSPLCATCFLHGGFYTSIKSSLRSCVSMIVKLCVFESTAKLKLSVWLASLCVIDLCVTFSLPLSFIDLLNE